MANRPSRPRYVFELALTLAGFVALVGCGRPAADKISLKSNGTDDRAAVPETTSNQSAAQLVERDVRLASSPDELLEPANPAAPVPDDVGPALPDDKATPPTGTSAEPPTKPQRVKALKPAPSILPAVMPQVMLSGGHAADCFVNVGDTFPAFALPDAQGAPRTLESLQGERLTIVLFWSVNRPASVAQLRDLAIDFAEPYAELGVTAVAINPVDTPAAAAKALASFQPDYPMLFDPAGAFFEQVGRDHLPRTYLLDKRGRILWFDIEYSRSTRRQLEQAIHAALGAT